MKKLKIFLQSNLCYFLLIIITLTNMYLQLFKMERKSNYEETARQILCTIEDYRILEDQVKISCSCEKQEEIIGYYDFKSEEEKKLWLTSYKIGDILFLEGTLKELQPNTNFNLWNGKEYGKIRNHYYNMTISKYQKIKENNSFHYWLKNKILDRIQKTKSSSYIAALVLGKKDYLDEPFLESAKRIGVLHIFAISSMHVSVITGLIRKLTKKSNKMTYLLSSIFVWTYYLLVKSISLLRTALFFMISMIDQLLGFNLSITKKLILLSCLLLLQNPFYIYDVGFLYSMIVSGTILMMSQKIESKKGYFKKLCYVSILSFLVSFPITIFFFSEINALAIFYNIIVVPLISTVFFPLSLATLLFPVLDMFLYPLTQILEKLILFLGLIPSTYIFIKPSIIIIIVYYIIIFFSFHNRKIYIVLLFLLFIHNNYNTIFYQNYVLVIDVGQGDSILVHSKDTNLLIDTGGQISNVREGKIAKNTLLPLLKSLGIAKLDYLVLSHGDYDHMGESVSLVNNFPVSKVIFNNGDYNELEKKLIYVLEIKKIPYYKNVKELNLGENKLYFLNTRIYDNENDNSSVIYTKINGSKLLFMGDAGVEKEKDILEKYNLKDIDFLKVGHHGSDTSSSPYFIDTINPKHSLISVGKNNRYGHPKKLVLDNLSNSKIYRTDKHGSIKIELNKNGHKIATCIS